MQITGKNLQLVARGLELGLAELHTQMGMRDNEYSDEDEVDELEEDAKQIEKLLARVNAAIKRECSA